VKETKIKTGKKKIIKKAKKTVKTDISVNVRKINNKIKLIINTAPKKNVIIIINAVITEKKPNNIKIRGVKTGTELFKTKIIIRLRYYLILGLTNPYSRKPKIIKFIKILLRVR